MKISIFQVRPDSCRPAAKLARISSCARRAAAANAELLIYPELMLSGYNVGADCVRECAQSSDGKFAQAVAVFAKENGIAIAYGYPELDGARLYNAARLINAAGEFVLNHRKTHLFGDFERELFTAGELSSGVADIGGWSVGLLICYDVEFPEAARLLALQGADLIVVPTALMVPYERIPDLLIPARAYENQLYIAYANYCGREADLVYCGKSTIAAPDGSIHLQADGDETLILGELSHSALAASRNLNSYLADRRPETYVALVADR